LKLYVKNEWYEVNAHLLFIWKDDAVYLDQMHCCAEGHSNDSVFRVSNKNDRIIVRITAE